MKGHIREKFGPSGAHEWAHKGETWSRRGTVPAEHTKGHIREKLGPGGAHEGAHEGANNIFDQNS